MRSRAAPGSIPGTEATTCAIIFRFCSKNKGNPLSSELFDTKKENFVQFETIMNNLGIRGCEGELHERARLQAFFWSRRHTFWCRIEGGSSVWSRSIPRLTVWCSAFSLTDSFLRLTCQPIWTGILLRTVCAHRRPIWSRIHLDTNDSIRSSVHTHRIGRHWLFPRCQPTRTIDWIDGDPHLRKAAALFRLEIYTGAS